MSRWRKRWKALSVTVAVVAVAWTALTIWVELEGPAQVTNLGSPIDSLRVLVVYDPDPIYNLDEQVCLEVSQGLAEENIGVVVATVAAASDSLVRPVDAVVLCSNTYNWAPDWAISGFVKNSKDIKTKPVAAITVGSGTTSGSHRRLTRLLRDNNIRLIDEREWWLMRPNDESRMSESNVVVARSEAHEFGRKLGTELRDNHRRR